MSDLERDVGNPPTEDAGVAGHRKVEELRDREDWGGETQATRLNEESLTPEDDEESPRYDAPEGGPSRLEP